MKICKNCNIECADDAKFCQECGEPLEIVPAPAQTESVSEPVVEPSAEPVIEPVEPHITDDMIRADDNGSQPTASQTETETESVKDFNVAKLLAEDPYYDDVPLEDKGENKTQIDKENLKKGILIVVVTLLLVVAITVYLDLTS